MADFSHLDRTTVAGAVAGLLADQVAIVGEVGNRILDFDPRTTGWDLVPSTVKMWDMNKKLLPCIIVDDNGGYPPFSGPKQGVELELYVWIMAGPSRHNERLVTGLSHVVRDILFQQQILGGPMVSWSFSLGTSATEGGYMARHTFRVSGILKRSSLP